MKNENPASWEKHPIQLDRISVKELSIKLSSFFGKDATLNQDMKIQAFTGDFDKEKNEIQVAVSYLLGEEDKSEIEIKAEIVGLFKLNPEKFPIDQIEHWAQHNAPIILMPYLREHVYSLSLKANVTVPLVPLYIVPTIQNSNPEKAD